MAPIGAIFLSVGLISVAHQAIAGWRRKRLTRPTIFDPTVYNGEVTGR
ncbi:hypothetical protein SARI_00453 [Salmonella enterica subsp. arizonae serovar 62:z4,z23:-]|uniref:Uncharacterized protein n=1 Tax=Salmonella arizonae (strain ATCC BAA-731 / CDC346-86 / RSK2980) TaxID=41514 RepID=A9MIF2_SALAR|nr:hypothetical protein SARI_00453 [Salmonella enterica subsp. arizonae serovar 62:z4,z23:-]